MMEILEVNKKLYQIVSKIGSGGFSDVYHCLSFSDQKNFALKKVKLESMDDQNTDLIMNEIELLKKLKTTDKVIELVD